MPTLLSSRDYYDLLGCPPIVVRIQQLVGKQDLFLACQKDPETLLKILEYVLMDIVVSTRRLQHSKDDMQDFSGDASLSVGLTV